MALIKCNECNCEISDTALACPKCGSKTKASESKNNKILILCGIAAFILFMIYEVNYGDSFKASRRVDKAFEEVEDAQRNLEDAQKNLEQ